MCRIWLVTGVGLALVLGGCSGGGPATHNGEAGVQVGAGEAADALPQEFTLSPEVEKSQDKWTRPTDPYFGGRKLDYLSTYATFLLRDDCMRERGVNLPHDSFIPDAPDVEGFAANGLDKILTVDLAKKYGYRFPQDPHIADADVISKQGFLYADGSREMEIMSECNQQVVTPALNGEEPNTSEPTAVRTDLMEPSAEELAQQGQSIRSQLNRVGGLAYQDPEVLAAAQRWRECMAPQGIVDLPDFPWDGYPPVSLMQRWPDWHSGGDPFPEEIEVATFDAQCRESSGWMSTLYETQWRVEQDFVDAHRAELAPILQENIDEGNRYLGIIRKELAKK